jgi:hypothetical protein
VFVRFEIVHYFKFSIIVFAYKGHQYILMKLFNTTILLTTQHAFISGFDCGYILKGAVR